MNVMTWRLLLEHNRHYLITVNASVMIQPFLRKSLLGIWQLEFVHKSNAICLAKLLGQVPLLMRK